MKKGLKLIFVLLASVIVGAFGLSLLVYLLFCGLNPQQMSNDVGYSLLMFVFTVPVAGIIGGIINLAWFSEGHS
jgi:uncharacterized membrane protein SpoIIM required for sporulation